MKTVKTIVAIAITAASFNAAAASGVANYEHDVPEICQVVVDSNKPDVEYNANIETMKTPLQTNSTDGVLVTITANDGDTRAMSVNANISNTGSGFESNGDDLFMWLYEQDGNSLTNIEYKQYSWNAPTGSSSTGAAWNTSQSLPVGEKIFRANLETNTVMNNASKDYTASVTFTVTCF